MSSAPKDFAALFYDPQFTNGVFHHLRKALSYKTNTRNLERLFSKVYELHLRILESTLPIFNPIPPPNKFVNAEPEDSVKARLAPISRCVIRVFQVGCQTA